jgi:hypothetical protein
MRTNRNDKHKISVKAFEQFLSKWSEILHIIQFIGSNFKHGTQISEKKLFSVLAWQKPSVES